MHRTYIHSIDQCNPIIVLCFDMSQISMKINSTMQTDSVKANYEKNFNKFPYTFRRKKSNMLKFIQTYKNESDPLPKTQDFSTLLFSTHAIYLPPLKRRDEEKVRRESSTTRLFKPRRLPQSVSRRCRRRKNFESPNSGAE